MASWKGKGRKIAKPRKSRDGDAASFVTHSQNFNDTLVATGWYSSLDHGIWSGNGHTHTQSNDHGEPSMLDRTIMTSAKPSK